MNRFAKGFRVISGIFVLINIIAFFLPMTQCKLENYPVKTWSQFNYITKILADSEPFLSEFHISRLIWAICFICLPLLLAFISGIWGLVGSDRQIGSGILTFSVLILYVGLYMSMTIYFPDNTYSHGIAGKINVICSGMSALVAIIALIMTPKEEELVLSDIPQINEMKQQNVAMKYSIIQADNVQNEMKESVDVNCVSDTPRGVMVGLNGLYSGAVISFSDGEVIKLGRLSNNDLVFEGQEKVSRNHCYIRWDADKKHFIICDFSSNGTYVNGSDECLPQNLELPIEAGAIIAIGDERNTFRLE